MARTLCATATALVLLVAASMPAFAEDAMTNAELTALLGGGKTIGLGGPDAGYTGELTLNADGTGSGQAKTDDGKVLTLTGTWRIEGDHFCPTWQEFNDGKEVCETWVKDGANKVKVMLGDEQIGVNHW